MASAFAGLGHLLPDLIECAGAKRPIATEAIGPSVLAAGAVQQALTQAGQSVEDIEFIVVATMTPDVTFPGAGCFLQRELGVGTIGALDVRAQCAGFLYGLAIADDFLTTNTYGNVLLVGAEIHSSALDYSPRGAATASLFGDGAGAALLRPQPGGGGVRSVVLHSDGSRHQSYWCEYPASRQHPIRFTLENFRAGKHYLSIDADAVAAAGREQLPATVREAADKAGVSLGEIDLFVLSHVFPEVARDAAASLGLGADRVLVPSERYGHLTAAALPVALSEAVRAGRVAAGATVCLAAAGAGLCWGSAVVTL